MRIVLTSLLVLLAVLAVPAAEAQEVLSFESPNDSYKEKQVLQLLEGYSDKDAQWFLAHTDLNGDGVNEYISLLMSQQCFTPPFCPHFIIAFKNDEPLMIGRFNAQKVLISSKKTYGIRQILVYNHPHNDFQADTYIWNPSSFSFEPEAKENP